MSALCSEIRRYWFVPNIPYFYDYAEEKAMMLEKLQQQVRERDEAIQRQLQEKDKLIAELREKNGML